MIKNILQGCMFRSIDVRLKKSGSFGRRPKSPIQQPGDKKEVHISVIYLIYILIINFRFLACQRMLLIQIVDYIDPESFPLQSRLDKTL